MCKVQSCTDITQDNELNLLEMTIKKLTDISKVNFDKIYNKLHESYVQFIHFNFYYFIIHFFIYLFTFDLFFVVSH